MPFFNRNDVREVSQQSNEHFIIDLIRQEVFFGNKDNISRTQYYERFYFAHQEIQWAFLASMVSRNAGWNMSDLYGDDFSCLMDEQVRKRLLLTYERANWLIFRDAYPQLLIYHYSKKFNKPLFHLLDYFYVSNFMKEEWNHFWQFKHKKRLMYAFIVNEQHLIQRPVIEHPLYKRKVFVTPKFLLQQLFHFSSVLFPTVNGELYGVSVTQFRKLWKRIELGKQLATILFHEDLYPRFWQFALQTEHTGSRNDYERFFPIKKKRKTPYLRTVMPLIEHHVRKNEDWLKWFPLHLNWLSEPKSLPSIALTDWFVQKQEQIHLYATIKNIYRNSLIHCRMKK